MCRTLCRTLALSLAAALVVAAAGTSPLFAGPLASGAAGGDPAALALGHLMSQRQALGLSADDLADVVVTDQVTTGHNGVTHVYLRQRYKGLEIVNANINVNIAADGSVLGMGGDFVSGLSGAVRAETPTLAPRSAIHFAAEHLDLSLSEPLVELNGLSSGDDRAVFSGGGVSLDDIPVGLAYYADEEGAVRLVWDTVLRLTNKRDWWNLWVDATSGDVVAKSDWIDDASYRVYAQPLESPEDGARTLETDPWDLTASPFGWHDVDGSAGADFTDTRGNNVQAQTDLDANNSFSSPPDLRAQGGGALSFDFPIDLAQDPSTYREAVVTNLFYWNNIVHDVVYQYGFDEASGNFQSNNYGRGGQGQDPVLADAQDGSGTNNANFGTPQDGFAPRMQMYIWTPPNTHEVVIDAPSGAAGSYPASSAEFGPALDTTGVSAGVVLAVDGTAPANDACEALTNGAQISGNIALLDRGACSFVTKVRNAQNAGAVGVIVANNVAGSPIGMADDGTGGDITISSVMVSLSDGQTIRNGLPASGTIRSAPNPPPNRDSDLDNGVIAHEYGHGISNRLTGGRTNVNCLNGNQSGGMGEGWSDFWAVTFTAKVGDQATDPRGVGSYVNFDGPNGLGIRQYPYTTDLGINPHTFEDIANVTVPHGVGSVWNAMLWEVYWNLVDAYGFDPDLYNGTGGNNLAIQLVIDGMKLQPCSPTMLDARDAILQADQVNNGGANQCLIWEGFAKRGMGTDADDGGGNHNNLVVTNGFSVPPECVTGCGNGICESGEDCNSCPGDCPGGTSSGAVCGNGICEAGDGENCANCAADCNGVQNGRPANRFCCGDGGGENPVPCSDSRCSGGGFSCTDVPSTPTSYCCGDFLCEGNETCGNCALDCTLGAELCAGGVDEDCDGDVDCDDADCATDPDCQGGGCTLGQKGDPCSGGSDCCSGACKPNGTCR